MRIRIGVLLNIINMLGTVTSSVVDPDPVDPYLVGLLNPEPYYLSKKFMPG
jgi:hypothetical protein